MQQATSLPVKSHPKGSHQGTERKLGLKRCNSLNKETFRFSNLSFPNRCFPEAFSFHLKGNRNRKKVRQHFDLCAQILCRILYFPSVFLVWQTVRYTKWMNLSSGSPACRNLPPTPHTLLVPRNKIGHIKQNGHSLH